jgi:AraC family transcriptional regulator
MTAIASWTNQTSKIPPSGFLGAGRYLARSVRQADAGGFPLAYWTDDGSEAKGPHGHADAHFMLVTSGRYETAARPDSSSGETLLIFNPAGTYHRDRLLGGGAFFTITIPHRCWQSFDTRRAPPAPVQLASPHAQMLARRALRELGDWSFDSAALAEALCWELAGLVAAADIGRPSPQWLARACEYLHAHYADSVDLRGLSRELGIHPVHLTRTFRTFLRCTPGEYLRARRLDKSAQMLTEGRHPLAQIAFETGFADQSHLNRHFGRAYGVSPGRYRKLTRN